jgi:hypothetical protein
MKNLNSLLIILVMTLVFVGCKKDDDAEPDNLPIGRNWKITQLIFTNSLGSVDQVPKFASCDVDDIYRFRDDFTYAREEGASKCDPNDPNIVEQGTWSREENKFVWDGDEFNIDEINKQTFKITATGSGGSSVTVTFTAQ